MKEKNVSYKCAFYDISVLLRGAGDVILFFFIASVMQHITVNWTLVLCLLTGGFTSDPDV